MRKEIENRLVEFAKAIEKLTRNLIPSFYTDHLSHQLIRSSTSAALNFGEIQAAESKNDLVHKNSIVLKELRESQINLKLLSDSIKPNYDAEMKLVIDECDQLIAIFHSTLATARRNK